MHFQGAVIREQGVTFAAVVVKKHVIDDRRQANEAVLSFSRVFPGMPVVLMAQDAWGKPTWYGRNDISHFMAGVPLNAVPWREYTVN